jgi:hypothetical protein
VLGADAASAALTLTAATYATKMLIVEIEAAAMDIANAEEWLTASISNAADAGIAFAFAVLYPRYSGNRSVSALA